MTETHATKLDCFVEDMLTHAQELHAVLRDEGDKNDIKDRITCLKYLEEVTKTYFVLKKASTYDPDASGSAVRKYASTFKNSASVGKARGRPRKPTADIFSDELGGDSSSDTAS